MRLQRSRAIVTLLRLVAPVLVMFLWLGPLAAPGFAVMDINEEVMEEVIDPCFLAVALVKGMSDDDLLGAMKALGQEAPLNHGLGLCRLAESSQHDPQGAFPDL